MNTIVSLYSEHENEIKKFLTSFFEEEINIINPLYWSIKYQNPIEIADIIGAFIENINKFKINMWVSLDKDIYINITDTNADKIIRYLFERYPY